MDAPLLVSWRTVKYSDPTEVLHQVEQGGPLQIDESFLRGL